MLWAHISSLSDNERDCLQVLDDSTCKVTRQLVDEKAAEWAERGIRCDVVRRTNRQGYKAGALKDVSPSPAGPLLALYPLLVRPSRMSMQWGCGLCMDKGWLACQHSIGSHKAREICLFLLIRRHWATQLVSACRLKCTACAGFGFAVGL